MSSRDHFVESLEARALLAAADPDAAFGTNGVATAYVPQPYVSASPTQSVRQDDGKLLINTASAGLARVNADGTTDDAFLDNVRVTQKRLGGFSVFDLLPNGKIVAAAVSQMNSTADAVLRVVRLNADGTIDTAFGTAGYADRTLVGTAYRTLTNVASLAADHAGRIVAYGQLYEGNADSTYLARFTAAGAPDAAFDGDGYKRIDYSDVFDTYAGGLLVQPDDRLVVSTTGYGRRLFRLNADGTPDSAYGPSGTGFANLSPSPADNISGLTQEANGRTYVLQLRNGSGGDGQVLVSRYTRDGLLDSAYGSGGTGAFYLDTAAVPGATAGGIAVDDNGYVAVTGTTRNGAFVVAGLTQSGILNPAFDGDGRAFPVSTLNVTNTAGVTVAFDPQGRLLATGVNRSAAYPALLIARLNANGTPDTTYAGGGLAQPVLNTDYTETPTAVARQADGKLLVTSLVGNNGGVTRLTADGVIDRTFGTYGTVVFGGNVNDVLPVADGKLIVLNGYSVRRLNANGSVDVSFASGYTSRANYGYPQRVSADSQGRLYVKDGSSVITRLKPDGTLDTAYGTGGAVTLPSDGGGSVSTAPFAVQADGTLFASNGGRLYRVLPGGVIDGSFNNGVGYVVGVSFIRAVAIGPDGKIYTASNEPATALNSGAVGVRRYGVNGALDTAYGTAGVATADIVADNVLENPTALAFTPEGTAVVSVDVPTSSPATSRSALVRFTPAGRLDTAFDGDGILLRAGSLGSVSVGRGALVDPSGRIVSLGVAALGTAERPYYDIAVSRFKGQSGRPTAVISGATTVAEGGTLALTGSSNAAAAMYAWDFNYNGATFDTDATGATPAFSAGSLDGPTTRTIALRVTDGDGEISDVVTRVVTITNAAPTAKFEIYNVPPAGQPVSVGFVNATDPAIADRAGITFGYDFNNDGDFVDPGETSDARTPSGYTFTTPGTYTIHGRVIDKDGGFTDYYQTATVVAAADTASVALQGESATLAGGTAAAYANDGYTGSGYADFAGQNSSAEWSLVRNSAGPVTLTFRYANGGTANRPLTITVNGTAVGTLQFPPTGAWTTWASVSIDAQLAAGTNKIKAVASTTAGGANVDFLSVTRRVEPTPNWFYAYSGAAYTFANNVLTLSAGRAMLVGDAGLVNPGVTIVVGDNAQLTFEATQHLGTLVIGNSAKATMLPGTGNVLRVNNLTLLPQAKLDLANASMVLDHGPTPMAGTVRDWLIGGRNGGGWNGFGIVSNTVASTAGRAIGYATAVEYLAANPAAGSTFAGEPIDVTTVVLKATYAGDANLDGRVDFDDFVRVQTAFGGSGGFVQGDFDYDGRTTFDDFVSLQTNFGKVV